MSGSKKLATCWRGHRMAGKNLQQRKGGQRECKACMRLRKVEWQAKQREGKA